MSKKSDATSLPGLPQIGRRDLIKTTGTVAAATGLGLFMGKAPAYAQQRELKVLEWSSFVKESDVEVDRQAAEFGKAEGIKVTVEHINNNDLPMRGAAATESKVGPDILQIYNNYPILYSDQLIDHSDLVQEAGGNKIYKYFRDSVKTAKGYAAVPYFATGAAYAYRTDIFKDAGVEPPKTYDDFLKVGAAVKKAGYPIGQALGHSFGDPPGFCNAVLWGFGGIAVDEHAKVAINSKGTRAALAWLKEFWSAACDESGLAWDDSANNRAFPAGTISATRNGASIYFVAKRNFKEKGDDFVKKIGHFLDPKGPSGSRHDMTAYSRCIFKYSKVQTAAKNYLRFCLKDANYEKLFLANGGYINGIVPKWDAHPFWKSEPPLLPYSLLSKDAVTSAWPAPYDRRASETVAKFIIVDMFARAVKGETVDSAVAFAENELKGIYKA
jgi:multiple sugar transport system substrate-binding protein